MKKICFRLQQPVPPFFRRLSKKAISAGLVCTVVLVVPLAMPPILYLIAANLFCAAFAAWIVCQLTVDTDAAFIGRIRETRADYIPNPFQLNLLK